MFSKEEKKVLEKILKTHGLLFDDYMYGPKGEKLPNWKIDKICNYINDEFMMKGISSNGIPSRYGIILEKLLDKINRDRIK